MLLLADKLGETFPGLKTIDSDLHKKMLTAEVVQFETEISQMKWYTEAKEFVTERLKRTEPAVGDLSARIDYTKKILGFMIDYREIHTGVARFAGIFEGTIIDSKSIGVTKQQATDLSSSTLGTEINSDRNTYTLRKSTGVKNNEPGNCFTRLFCKYLGSKEETFKCTNAAFSDAPRSFEVKIIDRNGRMNFSAHINRNTLTEIQRENYEIEKLIRPFEKVIANGKKRPDDDIWIAALQSASTQTTYNCLAYHALVFNFINSDNFRYVPTILKGPKALVVNRDHTGKIVSVDVSGHIFQNIDIQMGKDKYPAVTKALRWDVKYTMKVENRKVVIENFSLGVKVPESNP